MADRAGTAPTTSTTKQGRPRRGGRGLLILLIVLVVIGGGLVLADRPLHRYVEHRVATQLQTSLGTDTPPTVEIQGTPFLTQVVANHFGEVDVTARGVTSPERQLRIDSLVVHLHDVRTAQRYQRITADTLDGQATLSYGAVSTLSPVPLTFAGVDDSGQGRVQTTVTTDVLNQQLTLVLSGVLGVNEADQTLVVNDPAVSVAGIDIPSTVVEALSGRFLQPIAVGALPLGVRLTGVTTTSAGMVADLGGTDVLVSGG